MILAISRPYFLPLALTLIYHSDTVLSTELENGTFDIKKGLDDFRFINIYKLAKGLATTEPALLMLGYILVASAVKPLKGGHQGRADHRRARGTSKCQTVADDPGRLKL